MEGQQHQAAAADAADGRFPQWSIHETRELVVMRAELDQSFLETKRNKQLWELISSRMKSKGYNKSADQCKCKWKNLATRYKGCETVEGGEALMRQQFPFYDELQSIFTARMHRMLWASEPEGGPNGNKKKAVHLSSEDEDDDDSDGGRRNKRVKKGKRVIGGGGSSGGGGGGGLSGLKEMLEEFVRQQMAMEAQWMEAYEARENERRMKELEWRRTMEALESERVMMEQRWREREEHRHLRQEARAERRDALITALLNKLTREDL